MFIGIDTFGCNHGCSGIGVYLKSLVNSLPENIEDVKIELFGLELDRFIYDSSKQTFTFFGLHIPDSSFSEQFWHAVWLKKFIKKRKYDVVLYPASLSVLPSVSSVPSVLVVDELISERLKRNPSFFYKARLKKVLKQSKKIIVPSQSVKKDLVNFGVESDNINVIHNGIDHSLFYPREVGENEVVNMKPFAIKRPFIIYPAYMQYSEKKHVELINAFSIFKQRTGLPCKLVIAGAEGKYASVVKKAVLDSKYASEILMTGFFPYKSMPELYSCAIACVIPSVIEGFGSSVLEAMACGIPVVCARAGALPEIAGPDVVYFEPDNIEEMASAIETVVTENFDKEKMVKNNIDWVSRFTWKKTSQMTLDILKESVER